MININFLLTIGSLSNDDGVVNENGKKAVGLDWQNNNSAHASLSFIHFFAVMHDYDVKMLNFTFFGERELKTKTFFLFS